MTENKIIIRTTKNVFFKSKKYEIKLDGNSIGEINFENTKIECDVPVGKHTLEIGNQNSFKIKEIEITTGQLKILTINPSVTYNLGLGFFFGIAIASIIAQFFILDKISLPLIFIPLIPLFFLKKRHFSDSFEITVSK